MSEPFDNEASEDDAYLWVLLWHETTNRREGAMWIWECTCGRQSNGFFGGERQAWTAGKSHQRAERRKRYKAQEAAGQDD